MSTFFITFGFRYRTEEHPTHASGIDPDGWVEVEANSYEEANLRAHAVFNAYYSGLYSVEKFDSSFYPLGKLFSI